jgi:hypothetical protein
MPVHKNPPLLGTLSAALEGSLDVFFHALASQGRLIPMKIILVYWAGE